ncbi:spry domain protein [uncultured Mediterranean phage uvMED]|nr:spry domain protein [uncultured Mediterranean phage uvMED]
MASSYLSRASGTPTSTRKFTISFWFKKCRQGADSFLVSSFTDASNRMQVNLNSDDTIDFVCKVSASNVIRKKPNRKLRDPSSFYHITVAVDTTLGTAADRCKFYINGSQETSFASETNPSQNADVNVSGDHFIGAYDNGGSPALFFDGLMTHIHYTDGYTYQASDFGESDSVSGIWKPKTAPSVTYGTNGFFLKFENSGAMGTDSSGNSNTFTTGGTLTQNVDTPSNNFATFNPLDVPEVGEKPTYSYGNLQGVSTNAGHINGISSLAVETGKFYAEFKITARSGATDDFIGVIASPAGDLGSTNINTSASNNKSYGITGGGFKYEAGIGSGSYSGTYAINDIIGVGLDVTNNRLYFSKNGQWQNGTNWDSATPNSYITLPSGNTWHFLCGDTANSQNYTWQGNFGQGYFGTTQVASAGTAPSEGGIFEYNCPSGYQALCTKGINSF